MDGEESSELFKHSLPASSNKKHLLSLCSLKLEGGAHRTNEGNTRRSPSVFDLAHERRECTIHAGGAKRTMNEHIEGREARIKRKIFLLVKRLRRGSHRGLLERC